jgi:hypothetical protein
MAVEPAVPLVVPVPVAVLPAVPVFDGVVVDPDPALGFVVEAVIPAVPLGVVDGVVPPELAGAALLLHAPTRLRTQPIPIKDLCE